MPAASYDFDIEQGATLIKQFVWKDSTGTPVNLTGFIANMQVRQSASSPDVLLALSTTTGGITITPLLGKITLTFTATMTAAIAWRRGKYDLELTSNDGTVTRLIEGEINVSKEVTRV